MSRRALIRAAVRVTGPYIERARRSGNTSALRSPRMVDRMAKVGRWRMLTAYERALREVPAYREFVEATPRVPLVRWEPDFSVVPEIDKATYVQRFSIESRCVGGKLPTQGVVIDESSGSSGTATNWVRGPGEREGVGQTMRAAIAATFGDEPLFVINAFALGAWATGMHVTMSLADAVIVKSVGPDVAKIRNTITSFGPGYRYLICGYPPFLKRLVDSADLDWSAYQCSAVCGGEGMSEGLRDYLSVAFRPIYSSYGASDLEINVGAETDFTIALRRALAANPGLGEALGLPNHSLAPMIFQYNPLDYVVETNRAGELVITITRPDAVAPKIRYNIHDLGVAVPMQQVRSALWAAGVRDIPPSTTALPLLFHYGRSDQTVAFYGANIAPGDLEAALFSLPELARRVDGFAIVASEDAEANKRLTFALELAAGETEPDNLKVVRQTLLARLAELNQDYREAARMIPTGLEPTVVFHPHGTGPFEGADVRLKRDYMRTAGG